MKTVEESRQKGTLEDTLDAYVLVSYYESGYMISYMDKAEASSLPRPLLWMIFRVAVTVILTGACLVRYYLQRVSLRLEPYFRLYGPGDGRRSDSAAGRFKKRR